MKNNLLIKDITLILIMAVLAACGIIYQYILSQYAGRVLGMMEHAIFTMIGVMIVSMGVGAFTAKLVKCPYSGFAWLEGLIALFGSIGIFVIGGVFALTVIFPEVLATNYYLPREAIPEGGFIQAFENFTQIVPYMIGFIIGTLIGMEIPFIARVRENIYGKNLEHNVGTIYGADYIGAGIGAGIFIIFMLTLPPALGAVITASVNLIAGFVFIIIFFKKIKFGEILLLVHFLLGIMLIILFMYAHDWQNTLEDILYEDKVMYTTDTKFQHITITKRYVSNKPTVYALYLNGHLQFSSDDELIYHEMLVSPAILASNRHENVLVVGGGDGMAVREILKYNPKQVVLLELDKKMIELFRDNETLKQLNNNALNDDKLKVIYGDAFNSVDKISSCSRGVACYAHKKTNKGVAHYAPTNSNEFEVNKFDTIIVDLPDPSHPDINKLYSTQFYKKLYHLLNGDGAIVIQSTSPYHAKEAFLTVGVTLKQAGFDKIERYHQNVPTFGEWGWTIATKMGKSPKQRIINNNKEIQSNWATKELILSSFEFGKNFFDIEQELEPNRLGTNLMYILHQKGWQEEQ